MLCRHKKARDMNWTWKSVESQGLAAGLNQQRQMATESSASVFCSGRSGLWWPTIRPHCGQICSPTKRGVSPAMSWTKHAEWRRNTKQTFFGIRQPTTAHRTETIALRPHISAGLAHCPQHLTKNSTDLPSLCVRPQVDEERVNSIRLQLSGYVESAAEDGTWLH